MTDRAAEYKSDARDVHVIAWPITGKPVGLLLLRCDELQRAHFAARDWFKRQGRDVDGVSREAFEEEEMLQQCLCMLIAHDSKQPEDRIFKDAAQARQLLDADERGFFCSEHQRLQIEKYQAFYGGEGDDDQEDDDQG